MCRLEVGCEGGVRVCVVVCVGEVGCAVALW